MGNNNKNSLLCNMETGICELPGQRERTQDAVVTPAQKPVHAIYYTDPICSSCWGIEPQLKKLKLEYGTYLDMDYRMGGLLPDWTYRGGGISKPADVARHWDEASLHYQMPIDGDVWLEDPLDSSYPPSIAFKAAQIQNKEKAVLFLRKLREQLFLEKKNITKWDHLQTAAEKSGLDVLQLKQDFEEAGKTLFQEDLNLAANLGLHGFPTIFFRNETNQEAVVYGSRPYRFYEDAILELYPLAVKKGYDTSLAGLFRKFTTLTVKEFSFLAGISMTDAEKLLESQIRNTGLSKTVSKNGSLYILTSPR